jgi:hypothetical protein
MSKTKGQLITAAAVAGMMAFAGDFLVTIVLGFFYPHYNHLQLVMSDLGSSQSPVAFWVGLWWVVFGILFVAFAVGFAAAFGLGGRWTLFAASLIALFGLGAGVGAGLFPMDSVGEEATVAGGLHDALAGVGFCAIALVPLASLAVFGLKGTPAMTWFSIGAFVLGLAVFILFVISEDAASSAGILAYVGLWQRLFLLIHYTYLGVIAVRMLRLARTPRAQEVHNA